MQKAEVMTANINGAAFLLKYKRDLLFMCGEMRRCYVRAF